MAKHPKPRKTLRGFPGSTEAAARPVLKQIQKSNAPKKKAKTKQRDTGGKTTAKSPFKLPSAAKTAQAKKAAIAKRDARVKSNIKQRQQKAKPKPKPKRRSYGGKMT